MSRKHQSRSHQRPTHSYEKPEMGVRGERLSELTGDQAITVVLWCGGGLCLVAIALMIDLLLKSL